MANNTDTTSKQSYPMWEESVANSLSDKLEISFSDAQGIIESNEFYMAQAWAKGMDSKQTADYIDSKSSMAKGGGVENSVTQKEYLEYLTDLSLEMDIANHNLIEYLKSKGLSNIGLLPNEIKNDSKYKDLKRKFEFAKVKASPKVNPKLSASTDRMVRMAALQEYNKILANEIAKQDRMAKGGSVGKENLDMVKSQNKAISHHTKELQSQLNMDKDAPAWVVSKVSRASNDLSDVTHYLDGEKMADGGTLYKDFYSGQGGMKFKTEEEVENFIKTAKPFVRKQLREGNFVVVFNGKEFIIAEKIKDKEDAYYKMAKGGKVKYDKTLISSLPKNRRADKNYTHFAVRKSDNKILNGWDYSEYDSEDLNSDKKAYFYDDMDDMDVPKNEYTIKKAQTLIRLGINPFDFDNWRNLDFSNDKPYVEGKMANGGSVGEPYDSMTKYQLEKELKRLTNDFDDIRKSFNTTNHPKQKEIDLEKDKIITLLYGENFSGKGQKYKYANGGNIDEWDEEQYPSRRKMLESILSKEFGSKNQYSSSADWGGIPVWSLSGDDLEGTFIGIGDDDGLFIVEREQDYEEGDTKETEIMTASYDEIPKMKRLIAKAKTMQGKMADGGVIKGSNNKTGERFGVVIGSETISDEYVENGLELNVRKVYGSRISESKLIFDEKGNLDGIVDYGYSVDGLPNLSMGRGTHYGADKKKTIQILSEMYTPSFAKNLVQSVYTKMAKGGGVDKVGKVMHEFKHGNLHSGRSGKIVKDRKQAIAIALSEAGMSNKMANGGMIEIKKHGSLDNDNHIQYEVDVHEINPKFNHKLYGTIELDYEDKYFATYLNELFEKSEQEKHFETLEEAEKWVLGKMNKEKDEYIKDFGSKPANGGGDNEVVSFFKNIDYSKLPPAFTEYIKNEVLTDADLQYLSPKEPVFLEIKKKVEEYTNKSAVTTTATETGDSDEKKKVLQEIADLEGIKEFVSGDELNKINKEIDDLNGLLPIL